MSEPTDFGSRYPHIAYLEESRVEDITRSVGIWLEGWLYPPLIGDLRLELTDKFAELVERYGLKRLGAAVDHFIDNAPRDRPTLRDLENEVLRQMQKAKTPDDLRKEMHEHYEHQRQHPENFLPVEILVHIGSVLGAERKARKKTNDPMDKEEFNRRKNEMTEAARAKMRDVIAAEHRK